MRSLVCVEPGTLTIEDREKPVPRDGEVLIRIRRVGVCGTDMHIFHGRQPYLSYPRVMGHEFSGEVESAPADSGFAAGDAVLAMPYLSCGTCVACRRGRTNCCRRLQVLGVHTDGAMTDYLSIPARFVLKADGLSLDQAAMVEFLAIGAHAVRRAGRLSARRILVVGAGPIGLATALFAGLGGAEVTMIDSREDRLDFAARALRIDHAVALSGSTEQRLRAITDDDFFDVVFDATGNSGAMEAGFAYVAHGGTYVLVSIVSADITFSDPEFHKRETTLLASRNATLDDFETVMQAIREGRVPTAAFGSHRATLEELPDAIVGWGDPSARVIKALIEV